MNSKSLGPEVSFTEDRVEKSNQKQKESVNVKPQKIYVDEFGNEISLAELERRRNKQTPKEPIM